MKIIIAGAGEVGRHSAEVLVGAGHQITLIDNQPDRLESLAENLDVATLVGSAAHAEALHEAGAERADLFVGATNSDEVNLLGASVAKGLGTRKVVARVHDSVFHERRGLDYARHLGIDRLVCPEHLTSLAIAGTLRDPALLAIQHFARGQIMMEQLEISARAEVVGTTLRNLTLPPGFRIGTVRHQGHTIVPTGDTVLSAGDQITLVGMTGPFDKVVERFRRGELRARRIAIMGGSPVSLWLARTLNPQLFRIRLFEPDRRWAEQLAEDLPHVTVLSVDPTSPEVFAEENIADTDAFVASTTDDEDNILGALQAQHLGVKRSFAVIQRSTYHQLIEGLGIDRVFSPRIIASDEIRRIAQRRTDPQLAQLDEHGTGIYEFEVSRKAPAAGRTLMELSLPTGCVFIAIQRGDDVHVPGPKDRIEPEDTIVAIAQEGILKRLKALFA